MFRQLPNKLFILTGSVFLLLFSLVAQAQKTDVIILKNHDRVTGEIKSLARGKLELSTDHMGTIFIEWDNIQEIISKTGQQVEKTDGERIYGSLIKPENADILVVDTRDGLTSVHTDDVISMYPVESDFWDRLDIYANLGFSWDKGSAIGKYSLGVDTEYRRTKSMTRSSLISELTTQEGASSTKRSLFNMDHKVFKPDKKFIIYYGNLEQNDELGIDLRSLVGGGYGWIPIRSQSNWLSVAAGLDINRETPSEGKAETNLEAAGMLSYEYYRYNSPERSFKVNFTVFPSVTDFGRIRATLGSDFRLELFADLFWKLSLYANYDSNPISLDGASSDYGVNSAISYKF